MIPTLSGARQRFLGGLLFLGLVAIGSFLVWKGFGEQNPRSSLRWHEPQKTIEGSVLAVFGQAPDFSLTERSGQAFSRSDLAGKPWIADFIFTSCAGQCPLMSLQMARLQREFGSESGFQFVSFTVDPERDTPEVLAQYADHYGAEKERWFFLTGPKPEIDRITKGFFLSPADQPAMHSIRFVLIDRQGRMRGYYDSSDPPSTKQLVHDAKILLKE